MCLWVLGITSPAQTPVFPADSGTAQALLSLLTFLRIAAARPRATVSGYPRFEIYPLYCINQVRQLFNYLSICRKTQLRLGRHTVSSPRYPGKRGSEKFGSITVMFLTHKSCRFRKTINTMCSCPKSELRPRPTKNITKRRGDGKCSAHPIYSISWRSSGVIVSNRTSLYLGDHEMRRVQVPLTIRLGKSSSAKPWETAPKTPKHPEFRAAQQKGHGPMVSDGGELWC